MQEKGKSSVIIADDHPIFRKGLKDLILSSEEYTVVAEFDNGTEAWEYIRENIPEVSILDIEMPGLRGLEIAKRIHEEQLHVRTMILTMFDEVDMLNNAIQHGVLGYILKDTAIAEVMRGLDNVMHGNPFISTRLLDKIVNKSHRLEMLTREHTGLNSLTSTERKVLQFISANKSTKEIADELYISARTVEHHRANICRKLDLNGAYALLKFALEHKSVF